MINQVENTIGNKNTKFFRKSKKIKDNHNVYWKFETKKCCGGYSGFASKFYFYRKHFDTPDDQEPWYYGEITRMESKVRFEIKLIPKSKDFCRNVY